MRKLVAILMLVAGPAAADFVPMSGAEIQSALEGRKLQYTNAWQDFRASGRTLYNSGQDSWGYWAVRGEQYCSSWPPGEDWGCYDVARDGETIRFIGPDGSVTDGRYAE